MPSAEELQSAKRQAPFPAQPATDPVELLSFSSSNCRAGRDNFVAKLMGLLPVAAYGQVR